MKIIPVTLTHRLIAVLLLAVLLVAARPLAAQSQATIRVGVYNFEPLIFIDKDGAPKGIYLDVLESIAAREKWQIEYVPGTWQECLTRLETGAIDLLPSIGYTEERAQKLDFTNEYLFLDWGLVYRGKGKPIQTVLDLDGKKIAALKGSIYTLGLTKLLEQFDLHSPIVEKDEYTQVLAAVERGEVDAGIITKVYGLVLERNYPQIEATEIFFAPVKIFFAVPKGQHAIVRATLDREFAALKADKNSIYYSSLNKWIGFYQSKEILPPQVIVGFAGTLALLALFFGFTLALRHQVAQRTRELQADIAERERAEAALRESEARLRLISENTADVIWVLDPTAGKFTYVSPSVEKLRGYTPAEVMAQPLADAVTPESLAQINALLATRLPEFVVRGAGNESLTTQIAQPCKDGTLVHTEVTTTVLLDARGKVEIVGVSRDITERKRAEDELREREWHNRLVSEMTTDYTFIVDVDANGALKLRWASDNLPRLTGRTVGEAATPDMWKTIIHPDDLPMFFNFVAQCLARGEKNQLECRTFTKDRAQRWVQINVISYKGERGQVSSMVGGVTDITERKRAEEALRESEARYRQLFDSSPDAMFVLDATGQILDVNEIAVQRYGYARAELLQMTARDLAAPDLQDQAPARIRQAIETGAQFDWRQRNKDGRELAVAISARALTLNGQLHILSSVRDITERERAEQILRASEARFSSAFNVGPAGMTITRIADGKFIDVNESFLRMFEFSRADVVGHTSTELEMWTPTERQKLIQAQVESGVLRDFELQARAKSSRVITILFSSQPIELEGELCHITTMIDITERKRAEEKLRESEASLRDSQRVAHVGHWSWDTQTNQVEWSDEMKRIFGLDPATFDGDLTQVIARAIHPDDQAKVNAANQAVLTEQKSAPLEYRVVLPDQSVRTVFAVPGDKIVDADGNILKLTGVVQDITERKRAEDDIRQLNAQLEQRVVERTAELNARVDQVEQLNRALANLNDALQAKNRELETFTYSVSHDLKAPLRGIDGYSRLLLDDYADKLDADGRAFLQTIRRATDQMARLIDDLLAYSRVERRALTTGVVHPQALVDALIIERADDFKRRNVALNVALACNVISTDADGLTLILRNLLDNALKFTRDVPAPQIEIGGRDDAQACVLWVRDNGVGFEMKYHDRIFEIFQRLHRAEDYPGTGIGLAIVRKALERIGGRVWASSAPGQGATFFVEIPR
jgi:PAS domain S-box-containing protein